MKTLRNLLSLSLCLLVSVAGYAGDKASFLKKQFTARDGYQLNYRVLYPRNYDPARKYPVLLFLHGAGERGADNEAQLVHGGDRFASFENQEGYPAIILAPQCPAGKTWSEYKGLNAGKEGKRSYPENAPVTPPMAAVKELLDRYIAEGKVDTRRLYVTGLSMGGMGTFDIVMRYPDLFAAAAPICGGANLRRLASFKGKTAFSIYHGGSDSVVDVQFSRDAYDTLKKAGADVRYKEYPGVDHNSWDNAFAEPDYLAWMFQHSL
ncbi:MAG: prolyl oligopeptidase family serine peptidase [Parabacteroides sp.]|nr:prolyl oligopeptidase family serine peptidase [Parabacteroides sp.]